MKKIRVNLKTLISQKEFAENNRRRITFETLAKEVEGSANHLNSYALNKRKYLHVETLEKLLTFFDCGIEELLVVVDDEHP